MTSRVGQPDTAADLELRALLDRPQLGNFTMIAGAGSGKTTSLVKALAHVVATRGSTLRQRTQRVACITYTEVAAQEIFEDVGHSQLVHVSTIHAFLWSVVRPFQKDIGTWVQAAIERKLADRRVERAGFSPKIGQARRDKVTADIGRLEQQLSQLGRVKRWGYGFGSDYGRGLIGHEDVIRLGVDLITNRPLLTRVVARQYPFIFVDESQDTFPEVVSCLKHVAEVNRESVCLGFFGDPMQQIFMRGIGAIEHGHGWVQIEKPENFRSPQQVLAVMNQIRAAADGLVQVSGLSEEKRRQGDVKYFILPADDSRTESLELARGWLDREFGAGLWTTDDPVSGAKILVIEHRIAARRLGFTELFAAFNDNGSSGLSQAFREGTAWPLTPFLDTLLPLAQAKGSRVIGLLRQYSPALRPDAVRGASVSQLLLELKGHVEQLRRIVEAGGPGSIGQALDVAIEGNLIALDPRLVALRRPEEAEEAVTSESTLATLESFVACDVRELTGYARYIKEESPYATHQGVKGAEFSRVLVILDDNDGNYNSFSYEKLLGIRKLSPADLRNRESGKETIVERTRRLFYVCCSRATDALAIVLYAEDVEPAANALRASGLPGAEAALTLADIQPAESADAAEVDRVE